MTLREEAANAAPGAESFRQQADFSEQELSYVEISREWRDELLDPAGWREVLATFAGTVKVAVALTDSEGRMLGSCHNPQPAWRFAHEAKPAADGACPFCLLVPPAVCGAVRDALTTGAVVIVQDGAGLAHAAVPLSLGGQPLGALVAGQVFSHYPQPLPLQRVAKEFGVSVAQLWQHSIKQVPVPRATLKLYADLLMSLGEAFLGQRYAAILHRKLAQTSQRYRLFIDGVQDYALLTADRSARINSWSSGAERLFGYTEAEIVGRNCSGLAVQENLQGEALLRLLSEVDRTGWVACDGWRVRKDGTRFFGSGVVASIGKGEACEYGALIRDVTEIRQSEEELRQAQKLEGIGVLAGGIAHDFNNLLTGIVGSFSFIKANLPPENPAYPTVEIAEQAAARATELVAQLLAYAGKGKFDITRFDFSALISQMLPLIAGSIPRSVALELALAPQLPWIQADASQIRQVVMNLVINGAESIGAEGGTVRISTGVSPSGTYVSMEVKDSGSGMSEATKAQIFQPFFTTKLLGRGLGLAAVLGIVHGHKGKMEVQSAPGQGTTFTVSFPALQAEVPQPIDLTPLVILRGTANILFVDDESSLRQLAGLILRELGYSVLFAADGREAVEIFRQNASEIGLILLDSTMPVMGGQQALRLIREIRPDVPVIMSSGNSEAVTREEFGDNAADMFLKKPWGATELVEHVQQALQSSPAA